MKKTLLLLFLIFLFKINYAQDIIITFNGVVEGTTTNAPLDKVIVENLTKGVSKEITLTYNINLTTGVVLGLDDIGFKTSQKGIQNVYPNPFNEFLTIDFYSEGVGVSNVTIYNILGQKITSFSKEVEKGSHRLKFSSNKDGVYFIGLNDNGNTYQTKVISSKSNGVEPKLAYDTKTSAGKSTSLFSKNSSAKSGGAFFDIGDILRYTGYSGSQISTIYASPTQSNSATFSFSNPYYRFEPHLIEASIPSFVDIMFSVTDANNKGVDYLADTDFKVWEDGTEISPTETFRYVKRLKDIPYFQKTVIMLDNSSSVAPNLAQIKTAAISLVNKMVADQEIAIYSFSDNAVLLQDFTTNVTDLETAINSIVTGFPSTNLYGSLITGLESFTNVYSLDQVEEGYLIALTDGNDTQGSSSLQQVLDTRGKKRVFMAGLGTELDSIPLTQISSTGQYFSVTTAAELDANFNQIWLDIKQYSNSFYWLNYMSPKRTGVRALTVKTVDAIGNTNTNSDREITGFFNADGFQSVFSGVYANISADKLYGVDWVNLADDIFPGNLKAVTYWAQDVPKYTWSNDNPSIVSTNVNPFNSAKMALSSWSATSLDIATVTLTDIINNFTKEIDVFSNSSAANVLTENVSAITNTSATVSALAIPSKNNDPTITQRGIQIGFTETGFYETITENFGVGRYSLIAPNLFANTIYYTRGSIRTSDNQTRYSNVVKSFTTLPGLPRIEAINDYLYTTGKKTRTSAYIRTRLVNDGGDPLTEKGFVYSTSPNPTLATSLFITNGDIPDANGWFESNITNLTPDIDYYVRGYATNSFGTSYSYELKFKTAPERVPYLNLGISNNNIFSTSINTDVDVIYDGGSNVTTRGVCWSTAPNPTIALTTKTSDGTGPGTFNSVITGLKENTKYYIRAYATNSTGTGYSSEKTAITPQSLATIITDPVTEILAISIERASAKGGGTILSDGGAAQQGVQGICWSTSPNPTILDSHTGTGTTNPPWGGSFTHNMQSILLGTTFYVRAYVTNEMGTAYGNEVSFTTPVVLPILTTKGFSFVTNNSVTSGALNIFPGGGIISEKGVCWSTSPNPTIALTTKTSDGNGADDFTSAVFSVNPGATYYYRAYATNQAGTAYGNELSRTIATYSPVLSTASVTSITQTSALSGGSITDDGGQGVTARGVVWSTSVTPTIALDTKTIDGTGIGSFTSTISGLENLPPGMPLYVRAYATNVHGTSYGNEVSFTTPKTDCGTITDYDGNVYPSITIGSQCWMQTNLNVSHYRNGDVIPQVFNLTELWGSTSGAYCYYNFNTAYGPVFGKLYNWYAVNDSRGLAPVGWHVASDAEWTTLTNYLGTNAGGKMKETGTINWSNPNTNATNISGFTGLPGGSAQHSSFFSLGADGLFWPSTESSLAESYWRKLSYNSGDVLAGAILSKEYGFSVRCVKD